MDISIIIVTYNTKELLDACVRELLKVRFYKEFEIIFVDNNSSDGTQEYLKELQKDKECLKVIMNQKNFGFAKAVNQGVKLSRGEYILLLNSDAFIDQSHITRLIRILKSDSTLGAIAPQLLNNDKSVQPSFGNFPNMFTAILYVLRIDRILPWGMVVYRVSSKLAKNSHIIFPDWTSAACLLVRRNVLDRVGLLDEHYFMGIEDIDFCYRIRQAGYAIAYAPTIQVSHYHQYTSKKLHKKLFIIATENQSLKYFYKKFYPHAVIRYYLFSALVGLKENIQRVKVLIS